MNSTLPSSLRRERWRLIATLVRALDTPMLFLSAVWMVLLVIEFTRGLSPWLAKLNTGIWAAFIAQFRRVASLVTDKPLCFQPSRRVRDLVALAGLSDLLTE